MGSVSRIKSRKLENIEKKEEMNLINSEILNTCGYNERRNCESVLYVYLFTHVDKCTIVLTLCSTV